MVDRLLRKIDGAAGDLPTPEILRAEGARIGLVTVGACRGAVLEAMDQLRAEGVSADYMRIRAFPFHPDVEAFLDDHDVNYVIEQNRDGQLRKLLITETDVPKHRLVSVLYYGGLPMGCQHVRDGLEPHLGVPA